MMSPGSTSQTGTRLHMAPELLTGSPVSIRSDIYSLGVVLYQMLAGDFTRPVTTDWAADISDPLLREDLQHCFAGKPENRFAGAAQLARNLCTLPQRQAEREERYRAAQQTARRRLIAQVSTVAAAVLILLACALSYGLQRAKAETLKARRTAYASDMNVAWRALKENNLGGVVWLLNAQRPPPGEHDLRNWEWPYLWQACRGEQLWTLGFPGEEVVSLCLLPDGRLVTGSMGSLGAVRICDPGRREVVRLSTNINNVSGLAVSPDGRRIAVATWGVVVRFLDARSLEVVGEFQHTSPVYKVAFSPDGQLVSAHGNEDVSVWEVATRKKLWATKAVASQSDAPFLKDGHSLVCTIGDGRLAVLDTRDGRLLGALGQGAGIASTIAVSPDGRRLAAGTWSSEVLLTDLSTGHMRVLTNHTGPVHAVAFSPDGRQLASGGTITL